MNFFVRTVRFASFEQDQPRILEFLSQHKKTQVVGSSVVFGKRHAVHSVFQTLKAFAQDKNIAKTPEIEFLVRLSGERQISNALVKCCPKRVSVFVCWAPNAESVFGKFKKQFALSEQKTREPSAARQKQAIQKTATFWI